MRHSWFKLWIYSISQDICTRFGCALLCCGYAIVHNEFTRSIYHQGCFSGTGAIVRLPQCQWSKPDGYGKISQCITTTMHSKAKTVCIFLGIHCICMFEVFVTCLLIDHFYKGLCDMPSNINLKRLLFLSFIIVGVGADDTCGERKWLHHTKQDATSSKM